MKLTDTDLETIVKRHKQEVPTALITPAVEKVSQSGEFSRFGSVIVRLRRTHKLIWFWEAAYVQITPKGLICRLYKKSISLSDSRIAKSFDRDKQKLRVKSRHRFMAFY